MPRFYTRSYRPQPNRRIPLRSGPWRGVDERTTDPYSVAAKSTQQRPPERLMGAVNCFPVRGTEGGMAQRQGFWTPGRPASAAVQCFQQFTKSTGTELPIVVCGGEIYELTNWSAMTFTKRISTANLTSSSITLSSSAIVYALQGRSSGVDVVVFSDGTNTPFMWDGTAGGGLTKLTNAPVFYGQPTLHGGALFGIKNTDRITFVWSEPGDYTIGYEAGGYNNAWDFAQTKSNPLVHLVGSNTGLHVVRNRGVTTVFGTVDSEFTSGSTLDTISSTVGSFSPAGGTTYRDLFLFIDHQKIVRAIRLDGGGLVTEFPGERASLVNQIEASLSNISKYQLAANEIGEYVHVAIDLESYANKRQSLPLFDMRNMEYGGFWTYLPDHVITRIGVLIDSTNTPVLMVGTSAGYVSSQNGGLGADLDVGSVSTPIPCRLVTGPLGRDAGLVSSDRVRVSGTLNVSTTVAFLQRNVLPTVIVEDYLEATHSYPVGSSTDAQITTGTSSGALWAGCGPGFGRELFVFVGKTTTPASTPPRWEVREITVDAMVMPEDSRVTV